MYAVLHDLLSDRKGGEIFVLFRSWHFFYIILTLAVIVITFLLMRKKPEEKRERAATWFIDLAFALYIMDFFLMPFAYEEIDIEKLPFHICTAMCVMCFISRHNRKLYPYHRNFALLGFLSNFVYLIYPAGVMWHAVHPVSYRVIQTLSFHGIMTAYGFLTIALEKDALSWKTCYRELIVLIGMTLWAILGNLLYRGSAGSYSHDFNWFFVESDPFNLFDPGMAPFFMPVINIVLFFAVEMVIYAIYFAVRKRAGAEEQDDKGV